MNSIPSGLTVNTIFFHYYCCWVYFVISLPFFCTSAFFTLSFWFTKLLWFYFVLFVVVALAFFPFRSFRLEFRLHIIFVSVFFCFIIHFIILYRLWCVCVCVFFVYAYATIATSFISFMNWVGVFLVANKRKEIQFNKIVYTRKCDSWHSWLFSAELVVFSYLLEYITCSCIKGVRITGILVKKITCWMRVCALKMIFFLQNCLYMSFVLCEPNRLSAYSGHSLCHSTT